MILAGVLLVLYPVYTFGYTWFHQRDLRNTLEQSDPQITSAQASTRTGDFIPIGAPTTVASQDPTTTTQSGQQGSTTTTLSA